MHALLVILSLVAALFTAGPTYAGPNIATETFLIPTSDPQIKVCVRNKHNADQREFSPDKVALFVHGATYPSETAFDIDFPGGSWMDYMVERGFDTYLVDVRGYGGSTRPAAMDAPADQNPPFATTADAVNDVGAAVDFILKRRNIKKLNLIGWSWGTTIMASYTARNNDKVVKLVTLRSAMAPQGTPTFFRDGRLSECDQRDGSCKRSARNPRSTTGRNQSTELVRQMVDRKPRHRPGGRKTKSTGGTSPQWCAQGCRRIIGEGHTYLRPGPNPCADSAHPR